MERIAKWGTVLGASDVKYVPRTYVKGQVLAGLVIQLDESPLGKVLDRTKILHDPQTQTYGETSYFKKNINTRQNQSLAWSSDSNLWGN